MANGANDNLGGALHTLRQRNQANAQAVKQAQAQTATVSDKPQTIIQAGPPSYSGWNPKHWSTPGGIAFIFLTILFILFFFTDYNGKSRAEWVWLSIRGDTVIKPNILKAAG